jgi:hypothetical protein
MENWKKRGQRSPSCRVARDVLGGNGITLDFHTSRALVLQ